MKKYSFADYGFQFITVTAGVLIALFIDGLADWNSKRELVASAKAAIQREIAANKKDLDVTLSGIERDKAAVQNALKFADDILTRGKTSIRSVELNYNLADLSSTSWHTAERTGALGLMDYGDVQRYSLLYDRQDLVIDQQRSVLTQLTSAMAMLSVDFDPDRANRKDLETFRERVMLVRGAMKVAEDFSKRLAKEYAEILAR